MRLLIPRLCQDGSSTFFVPEVGEAYHAPAGAALEAREKFVAPCDIPRRASAGMVRILDVCYGLGYNAAAALERFDRVNPRCRVEVVGLEIDASIVRERKRLPFPFAHQELFDALADAYDPVRKEFAVVSGPWRVRVLVGDARRRLSEAGGSFDIVFFDPFSPGKAPHLWSERFFRRIRQRCSPGAVLVTYSCARRVRDRLRAAGFLVEDGPVVGRRGPATLARVPKDS